jgi:hypothetical protein
MRVSQRLGLLLCLGLIWIGLSACSCGDVINQAGTTAKSLVKPAATATRIPLPTAAPLPTATLLVPTAPAVPEALVLPPESNQPFIIDLTEAQVNEYLAGQKFEQQGVTVQDVRVTLLANEIVADLRATYAEAGLSGGARVRGVPVAVDGQLYIKINEVTLDSSISGFTRLIAQQLINKMVRDYSSQNGIPVPLEDVRVEAVQLQAGKLIVSGRTR